MKRIAFLGLQLAAFAPSLHWALGKTMHSSESRWELVPAVVLVVLVLAARGEWRSSEPPWRAAAAGVAGVATLSVLQVPLLQALAATVCICASLAWLVPRRGFFVRAFALGALALPVLPLLQYQLGYPLRAVVAGASAPILRASGLAVTQEGTCLAVGERLLLVDAPCSGLRMLWTGLFLTVLLAALFRFDTVRTLSALGLAFLAILAANIARTIALVQIELATGSTPGWAHEGIGLVAQAGVAACLTVVLGRWARTDGGGAACAT